MFDVSAWLDSINVFLVGISEMMLCYFPPSYQVLISICSITDESVCPVTDDTHFDHLITIVSDKFFTGEVILEIFLVVINKYLLRRYWYYAYILFLIKLVAHFIHLGYNPFYQCDMRSARW